MSNLDSPVATAVLDTCPPLDAPSKDASAWGKDSRSVSPSAPAAAGLSSETNAQSQPMTATASSSSSLPPPPENGDSAASGYGTRSRNRTGGRPNYAEDKELDLEIEALSKPSRSSKRAAATIDPQPVAAGFGTVNGSALPDKPSDDAPPAAVPAPSKKRKHPGSNHTVAAPATTVSTTRAKPNASVPFKGYVETNMMSFSRSGSKLNAKKQLTADDGTTIQANGKSNLPCCILSFHHTD
jgi:hypothetical protein